MTPDPRRLVAAAALSLARAQGAPVVTRPLFPGDPGLGCAQEPAPLAALAALRQLALAAGTAIVQAARRAREDGATWGEMAVAAGYEPDLERGLTAAERAFRAVASAGVFRWACPACGQYVTDRGPGMGNLLDAEEGHGDGCPRTGAAVRTHQARRDDDAGERGTDG